MPPAPQPADRYDDEDDDPAGPADGFTGPRPVRGPAAPAGRPTRPQPREPVRGSVGGAGGAGGVSGVGRPGRAAPEAKPYDPKDWQAILRHVRRQQPALNRTWFDDLAPRVLGNGMIQVLTPTLAQLNFCQGQCQAPFTAAAQAVTGRLVAVTFHCSQVPAGGVFSDAEQPLPLNPDYTFDQFVAGPGNRLAHAAAQAVADQPGTSYNPLFIHGGVGLGKSHLLQAVCQSILERAPESRILYLSCDAFINQFMGAVADGEMADFRHRFRNAEVLVIDDIHFLKDRERTQEEFFHTFNTLYQQQRQIILSADCPPEEIPQLEERLISRFKWGLVAPVEKPCYDTRVAIVRKKSAMRGLALPDDVICHIAGRVENNTRELEGAVTKLQGMAMLNDGVIDLALARAALGEGDVPSPGGPERQVTIQHILDAVTAFYTVKLGELQGKRRHKSIVFPRQMCMFLARRHTRHSLEEVGGYFGGRDHTTVLHAVRAIEGKAKADEEVARQVAHLETQLGK